MATLGTHLVGSLPSPSSARDAFLTALSAFPSRLLRLPDGEPGPRAGWIEWQRDVFPTDMQKQFDASFNPVPLPDVAPDVAQAAVHALPPLVPGYFDAAMESWEAFKGLKEEGKVPQGWRFQVSLPTPVAVVSFLRPAYQPLMEPLYERALLAELERLQDAVPVEELAVQWDFAAEIVTIEGARWPIFDAWFEDYENESVRKLARLVGSVREEVQVGVHLCYGDIGNKHSVEPKDTGLLTRVANEVIRQAGRKVDWVHMPVPIGREDDAYFEPLKGLEIGETDLYLGLVHGFDEDGTKRRIETAKKVVEKFGIGTECGMGRTPGEKFGSIGQISTKFSQPVV
ncbi:hypothetical protein BDZ85DRAFT_269873 [Elsinoe ampelina]|uniref:Uncharacterized protein n=1 Tax=Elsinoe ampelina TaxID=302913 RepID=A0A6A6FZJ7_9PEZI|nr:hypothetical protein BDZ85DRAFT_269873 [Elsinoe ampelina]